VADGRFGIDKLGNRPKLPLYAAMYQSVEAGPGW
jgi:hypothetical protein